MCLCKLYSFNDQVVVVVKVVWAQTYCTLSVLVLMYIHRPHETCRAAVPVENCSAHISDKLSVCVCMCVCLFLLRCVHPVRLPRSLVCKRGCVNCDL